MTKLSALIIAVVAAFSIFIGGYALAGDGGDGFDAHATTLKYFFDDSDMDFHFGNLVLGAAVNRGVAIGEAFYAASQIQDGNAADWAKAWTEMAGRVLASGEKSLAAGHKVSARDQLLRAANYYRIATLGLDPAEPNARQTAQKCRDLMIRACALFDPPVRYAEIPFEDATLPCLFWPAANDGKPAKTLLMIGGGETFMEDLFFYLAPQAHERGYNFITVDLPGQGMMPFLGKVFRTDTYIPLKTVVDWTLNQPEVDARRLAAYGISGGGLFVPQAAQHDQRLKAIAMNSAVVDAHALFATMPEATPTDEQMAAWTPFHANVVRIVCWRYGVDKPSGLVEANRGNTFDPKKVKAPALIIVGEGEYQSEEVRRQEVLVIDNLPNPKKKMVVTPKDQGASNHCIMENRALVGQVLFDWLDEVFE